MTKANSRCFCVVYRKKVEDGPRGAGGSSERQRVHKLAESGTLSAHTEGWPPRVYRPTHEGFPRRSA